VSAEISAFVCSRCPNGENVWSASAFRAWIAARFSRPMHPICGDCLFRCYPKVWRPCWTCGTAIYNHPQNRHVARPQCRRCKAAAREAEKAARVANPRRRGRPMGPGQRTVRR
jgi:hypothetical protein